jgi:DNA-binding NtrC family response regulator
VELRIDSGQEALLDRGGHPTLREFLKHLVFSPASGSIHLSHERLVLQRASQMSHLRDQLIERCGREEAFIQLTRLGFVAGVEDADFIRSSWLGLDPGDVFTAGTRLHMLRGCVHLKTVHNDFDLRKGKFSGEFLWSGSAEAAEFRRNHGPSEAVCWSHVGYASGYATRCFGKLIVYKEVECLGMGHEHCRVVGKPAEGWGEHDEIVQIYRRDIWPAEWAATVRPSARTSRMEDDDAVTELLLAPVSNQLGHIARFDVPLLITGERGTGKRTAARAWHEARPGASGGLDFVPCDTLDGDSLDALFGPAIRPRRERGADRERKTIVLTDVDLLAPSVQRRLARRLEDRGTRVAATTCQTTDELRASTNFDAGLLDRLAVAPLALPPLRVRQVDIPALAERLLRRAARRHAVKSPTFTDEARRELAALDLPGNASALNSLVTAALMAVRPGASIGADLVLRIAATAQVAGRAAPSRGGAITSEALTAFASGSLTLDELNRQIYRQAMERGDGNVAATARLLGLSRAQLAYRLKQVALTS